MEIIFKIEGDQDMTAEKVKLKKKGQNLAGDETPDVDVGAISYSSNYLIV